MTCPGRSRKNGEAICPRTKRRGSTNGVDNSTTSGVMEIVDRFFPEPRQSVFLFGPRGTGKSTWLKQRFPDAVWVDLLEPELPELVLHDNVQGSAGLVAGLETPEAFRESLEVARRFPFPRPGRGGRMAEGPIRNAQDVVGSISASRRGRIASRIEGACGAAHRQGARMRNPAKGQL